MQSSGDDRRDQQGRQRADLRVRRSRRRRRPARDRPEADRAREAAQVVSVEPADYPPPFGCARSSREPTRSAGRADRRRRPDRRRGPCRSRVRDPARAAARGGAGRSRERLGDVPFAVLEKGKQVGSHLLSGAVVNPRSLRALFGDKKRIADMPFYGEVRTESVYYLTRHQAMRIPAPPTMKNHHNYVASLSQLGRWLARGGGGGRRDDPAGDVGREAARRARPCTRRSHRRPRPRTERRGARELRARLGHRRARHRALRRDAGHLTGAAIERFGLAGENPQVWALGVKEVWKVPRPLDRVIHTMGWPLRASARYREFGGSFIYPIGRRHGVARDGRRPRLPRRRAVGARPLAGAEDCIRSSGASSTAASASSGARRRFRRAASSRCRSFRRRAFCCAATAPGLSTCPRSRACTTRWSPGGSRPRRRSRACGRARARRPRWRPTTTAMRESFVWKDLQEVRNMRQAFGRGFWLGGAMAGAMTATKGHFPPGNARTERDAEQELIATAALERVSGAGREADVRQALVRLRVGEQDARRPAESHPRADAASRRSSAGCGSGCARRRCTSGRTARCRSPPSNCVQCGAITAKGGRLTPPEGGSGPEYRLT